MSTTRTEAQELREMLQAAISEKQTAEQRAEAAEDRCSTLETTLEAVMAERNKLRTEKALAWGRVLGRAEDAPDGGRAA